MQPKSIYHVIGLMSGSSLDGLDIAFCRFEQQHEEWIFKILAAQTFQYSKLLQKKLATLHQVSAKELMITDVQLARLWEAYIEDFILKNEIEKVDFIASHGHTIFHEPKLGFSTQIGNGATIAAMTGIPTVCDFRSTDIALGGQGAPLVPMGDLHLFKEYTACLNLGGICNISLKKENQIFAYDIAPCNQLLNFFAKEIGKDFDENGNGKTHT
jgi:anhydro-N-acetylmuramic acid kinase